MTRSTLHRNAPGGHYPDCILELVCHCPVETPASRLLQSRPVKAVRAAREVKP